MVELGTASATETERDSRSLPVGEPAGQWSRGWARLRTNRWGLAGGLAVLGLRAAGVCAPLLVVVTVIAVFGWTAIARVVRGQTLSLVNREFVLAARSLGAGWRWILIRELLPNLTSTVIVFASLSVPAAVGTEAALSFLGVG